MQIFTIKFLSILVIVGQPQTGISVGSHSEPALYHNSPYESQNSSIPHIDYPCNVYVSFDVLRVGVDEVRSNVGAHRMPNIENFTHFSIF